MLLLTIRLRFVNRNFLWIRWWVCISTWSTFIIGTIFGIWTSRTLLSGAIFRVTSVCSISSITGIWAATAVISSSFSWSTKMFKAKFVGIMDEILLLIFKTRLMTSSFDVKVWMEKIERATESKRTMTAIFSLWIIILLVEVRLGCTALYHSTVIHAPTWTLKLPFKPK